MDLFNSSEFLNSRKNRKAETTQEEVSRTILIFYKYRYILDLQSVESRPYLTYSDFVPVML